MVKDFLGKTIVVTGAGQGMVITKKEKNEKNLIKMPSNNPGSTLEKILSDVSKQSATKQILIGAASGWVTGFASAKVGRLAAFTIGGAIILLEVANEQGIIKIDWSRLYRKVDEAGDKVQKTITGEGPKWMDKAERYVDRKLDQAENAVKKSQNKAKKWYSAFIGDESGPKINNLHIFLVGFTGGVAIGLASA